MTLEQLINKCISSNDKNWRKDDYNLSSYNCQDFVVKVIDEPTLLRHNYALSIYPPVIIKALDKNEENNNITLKRSNTANCIPIFGPLAEIMAYHIAKK